MSTNEIKTEIRGAFPGKEKKPPKPSKKVNLSAVKITKEPYNPAREVEHRKYDELFANIVEGDCVTCDPADVDGIDRALRMHLKRKGVDAVVRRKTHSGDGRGRVWLYRILRPKLKVAA